MKIYANASWEEDDDDSKFTHDHFIFMTEDLVVWKSQKQQFVALLSIEAKYVA
jgi:hypothetical protein